MGGSRKRYQIKKRRAVSLILVAVLSLSGLCANGARSDGMGKVTGAEGASRKSRTMGLHVKKTKYVVGARKKVQTIRIKNVPSKYSVDWKSSNRRLARVKAGRNGKAALTVTPIKKGRVKITAIVKNKKAGKKIRTFSKLILVVEEDSKANPIGPPSSVPSNQPTNRPLDQQSSQPSASPPTNGPSAELKQDGPPETSAPIMPTTMPTFVPDGSERPMFTHVPKMDPEVTYYNSVLVKVGYAGSGKVRRYLPTDFPEIDASRVFIVEKGGTFLNLLVILATSRDDAVSYARAALAGNKLVESVSGNPYKPFHPSSITLNRSNVTVQEGESLTLRMSSRDISLTRPFDDSILVNMVDGMYDGSQVYTVEDFWQYGDFEDMNQVAGATGAQDGYHLKLGSGESFLDICEAIDAMAREEIFSTVQNGAALYETPSNIECRWSVADSSVVDFVTDIGSEAVLADEWGGRSVELRTLKQGQTTITLDCYKWRMGVEEPIASATCTVTVVDLGASFLSETVDYYNSLLVTVGRGSEVRGYSPADFPEVEASEVYIIEKDKSDLTLALILESSGEEALASAKEALRENELVKKVSNNGYFPFRSTVEVDKSEVTLRVGEEVTLEMESVNISTHSPFINNLLVKLTDGIYEEDKVYTVEDFPEYYDLLDVHKMDNTPVGSGYLLFRMGGEGSFLDICRRMDRAAQDERFDIIYNGIRAVNIVVAPLPPLTSEWTVADPTVVAIMEGNGFTSSEKVSRIAIKALKEGTTTVTLEHGGNALSSPPTATCTVTVVGAEE